MTAQPVEYALRRRALERAIRLDDAGAEREAVADAAAEAVAYGAPVAAVADLLRVSRSEVWAWVTGREP